MRFNKHKRSATVEFNITPMIDVVFLLIIFFVMASQLAMIKDEPVQLPKYQGSEEQKPSTITVNVNQAGELIVAGDRVSLARFLALVSQELAAAGGDTSLLTVVVRGDQRSRSGPINEIVASLGRLGIKKVRIAVESASP
jgi:biopolymer transport protein ExbD